MYSPEFKAQVVLEIISEAKTQAEIARHWAGIKPAPTPVELWGIDTQSPLGIAATDPTVDRLEIDY